MKGPITLYKYRAFDDYGLRMLSHDEVFFSAPANLNDPRDCTLPVLYERGTKVQMYRMNLRNLRWLRPELTREERRKLARHLAEITYANREDPIRAREFRKDIAEHMNKVVGIMSLSAVCDNPVMWGHYAAGHSGFCVGFDTSALVKFISEAEDRGILILLDKVTYFAEMPVINPYLMDEGGIIMKMVLSKSDHWSYEEEYRLICADRPNSALSVGPEVISEVVLGSNCSPDDRSRLIEILRARDCGIKLYQAEHEDREYRIRIREIEYS